jgi:hypothetical protein
MHPDRATVTWYSNMFSSPKKKDAADTLNQTDEIKEEPAPRKVRIVDLRKSRNVVPEYHTERMKELNQIKSETQFMEEGENYHTI